MNQPFDAYHAWLGIPPDESADGGPHHYRLLGIRVFESNPQVIDAAARRVATHLNGFQDGPYQPIAQRMIYEVWSAAACLLDPAQKAAYDHALTTGQPLPGPVAPQYPTAVVAPVALQPQPSTSVDGYALQATYSSAHQYATPSMQPQPAAVSCTDSCATGNIIPRSRAPFGARPSVPLVPQVVRIFAGGVVGLTLGYFLVYYLLGYDVFELLPRRPPLWPPAATPRP